MSNKASVVIGPGRTPEGNFLRSCQAKTLLIATRRLRGEGDHGPQRAMAVRSGLHALVVYADGSFDVKATLSIDDSDGEVWIVAPEGSSITLS